MEVDGGEIEGGEQVNGRNSDRSFVHWLSLALCLTLNNGSAHACLFACARGADQPTDRTNEQQQKRYK